MPNFKNFQDRLLYAMEQKAISASELCRLTDIQPAQMSRYTNGVTSIPSKATVNKLALKMGVSAKWLEDGSGGMWNDDTLFKRSKEDPTIALAVASSRLSSIASQLVETSALRTRLPDSVKSSLLEQLETELAEIRKIVDRSL